MITNETARLIREADVKLMFDDGVPVIANLDKFAALVAAAERDRLEPGFKQLEALMQARETQPNKPCCLAERERINQSKGEHMNNTEIFSVAERMASHYVSGYCFNHADIAAFARWAAEQERERIIQFLQEMQRQVGDAHNHYGHAAVRIKEGV